MLSQDGKFSVYCFLITFSIVLPILVEAVCPDCIEFIGLERNVWWLILVYYAIINLFLFIFFRGFTYKVNNYYILISE